MVCGLLNIMQDEPLARTNEIRDHKGMPTSSTRTLSANGRFTFEMLVTCRLRVNGISQP